MPEGYDPESKLGVLRSSKLLRSLTDAEISALAGSSSLARVDKGEVVWMEGSQVDYFGVVATGFLKMSTTGPAYQEVTTEIIGPTQVFGLLGVLSGAGCPQSAKAVTAATFVKVRRTGFLPVYDANVVLKEQLLQRASQRLRHSFELIAHLSVGTVEQRIAAVLLVLSRSFGLEQDDGVLVDVPLTRQEISELAGTTVESTIRVISRWQKLGWVQTRDRHILLREMERLEATVHH